MRPLFCLCCWSLGPQGPCSTGGELQPSGLELSPWSPLATGEPLQVSLAPDLATVGHFDRWVSSMRPLN